MCKSNSIVPLTMKYKSLLLFPDEIQKNYQTILIVGDIHGDIDFTKFIFSHIFKSLDLIIFLGDYADRGDDGPEVINFLNEKRRLRPHNIILLKGNHESFENDGRPKFSPCDLIYQTKNWEQEFKTFYKPFFNSLYLSVLIRNLYLLVHGGISSKIKKQGDLFDPSSEIEEDILWSDPLEKFNGEYLNSRGCGVSFGKDVTGKVLKILGVNKVIRSHQPSKAGQGMPHYDHSGLIETINSSSYYGIPFVKCINTKNWSECVIHKNYET